MSAMLATIRRYAESTSYVKMMFVAMAKMPLRGDGCHVDDAMMMTMTVVRNEAGDARGEPMHARKILFTTPRLIPRHHTPATI